MLAAVVDDAISGLKWKIISYVTHYSTGKSRMTYEYVRTVKLLIF